MHLTYREYSILDLIRLGYPNKQIAHNLNLSYNTVIKYIDWMHKKTGVHNRVQLVLATKDITSGRLTNCCKRAA